MEEVLTIRVYEPAPGGSAGADPMPTLIYLPGLHGDWTLVAGFRSAVAQSARFVEMTYPRSVTWSLEDYAAAIERALEQHGISSGWLVAESFGSQVGWQLVGRGKFRAQGLILAGGFVRYPVLVGVRTAAMLARNFPVGWMKLLVRAYACVFRVRYRRSPEVLAQMQAFLSRRTELDLRAAEHRLNLIAGNDPCSIARQCLVPVFSVTGFFDPIVPWVPVRSWLRRRCPSLREHKIIWRADHMVLATAPVRAADQVLRWVQTGVPGPSPR
jgi:pimeloyl-ACP methyl ester carboxylesterase